MRNNFQNKNIVRRVAVLDFCSSSLISGLIEDSQILIPASAFNLLQCIVFVKENLASQIRSWKGKIIYINFSDCCGYSSLTLQQNSANCDFLEICLLCGIQKRIIIHTLSR